MLLAGRLSLAARGAAVAAAVAACIAMVWLGYDRELAYALSGYGMLGAAAAGAFYTLGVTTPFAMVVLVDLMRLSNPAAVATTAAAAAAAVDCALFWVARDALEAGAKRVMARIRHLTRRTGRLSLLFGTLVFGLPLPDELGLAVMEMTEIRLDKLFVLIFMSKLAMLGALWLSA